MIEYLPQLTPDAARSERTRARCHKALVRQVRQHDQRRFRVERAVLLGFSAIYLSSLALTVARVLIR